MATNILGLFTSPEQYQANQMAQFRQQSANEVQLDPFQQAAIGMRQTGYQLGGGIGGALGGQDPQLQKIAKRQAILGLIDPNNPDSYTQAIQVALQSGDQEAAFILRNEMGQVRQQAQEQQMNEMKRQDYLTQRGQGIQAAGLTNMANELVGQLKNPDGTINEDVKAKLLSFPQGRAAISEQAKILPELRQLGASGVPETNPFDLFINDPTVPAPLKTTARQYQSSFAKGIYSPEQADKLVERLSTATQKAAEFQQTQSRLEQNQQMLDSYRQQGLANSQASLNLQRQQAELNADLKRQDAERKAEIAKNKPLPANLQKSEEDDYDIATSATNLATDANAYVNRIKSGEIDLIAVWKRKVVVFVEVKTWASSWENAGGPSDAVDEKKQEKITRVALAYMKRHHLLESSGRADVIAVFASVQPGMQPEFRHFVSAFEAIGQFQMFS